MNYEGRILVSGLIRANFAGELNEVMKCQSCGFENRRPETFLDLILPVSEEVSNRRSSVQDLVNA